MILEADLYAERGIWRGDSAYVIAKNDPLLVSFGTSHAEETVTLRSACHVDSYRLNADGALEVDPKFIEPGTLLILVQSHINGRCIGEWKVDPLSIVIAADAVTATPWTVSVDERLAALENAILGYSSPIFE